LVENPLVLCQANRELISGKGRFQSIDLKDVRTLLPTYDKDRGSLVAVYRKKSDISRFWPDQLKEAVNHQRIDQVTADELAKLFGTFTETYTKAIKEFWKSGLGNISVLTGQLKAYSHLLIAVCRKAKGDRNREALLRPLLEIGAVPVDGGPVAAITAPWHPFRLAAMANKALQVTSLIRYLVTAENVFFGDTKLYFEELKAELDHPYYPEIILGWKETKPELLALSDHYLDYSLHEPPIMQPEIYADTNENPSESALLVIDILKRYLALHPHERANLSVVLYNCDSARLPHAIVDKIQEIYEDEEDMRCQVILRHRNRIKLRELYERIMEASGSSVDSFIASEATRDFMARLRIGIMADEAPTPEEADGAPTDVIFLQDVIARHAQLEWYPENAQPIRLEEWVPPRWSRRRPAASDDMKSVVYLSCPVASIEGWNYLTALTTFLKGDWDGIEDQRLLPARQLNFNDPTTAAIFKEVHNLGNWVVNYDELLDRRQLLNQNVKVIRYKQTDTQGRNMLISTKSSMTLLHRMVLQRIKSLTLGLEENELPGLAQRFIDEANLVSGDIVLRAAKRGRNASELMGIVLSRYLIQNELPGNRNFGWYFLDDYADWLGQKEGRIADILALSPETDEHGNKRLAVVISESKYIDYESLSDKRKESQKQLRDTMRRIDEAIFGDPKRLDRDLWLSRFSDLMLDGIHFPANWPIDLHAWRRAVREGECSIYMRGYSHIFVSGPSDSPECSDFVSVAGADQSWQEVFSRARLRELVLAYAKGLNPTAIRVSIAGEDIWGKQSYRKPSGLIQIVHHESDEGATAKAGGGKAGESNVEQSQESKVSPISGGNLPSQTPPTPQLKPDISAVITGSWAYQQVGDLIASYQGGSKDSVDDEEWLRQIESKCKGALQQFQLQSKLLTKALTPNAALLKFQGSANLTVELVLRRRSEFLTTHGLNVISVRAEPGVVAIAIARPNRRVLHLPDVWKKWSPNCTYGNHDILIAVREEDSSLLYLSPKNNAPHTLIAGSTGSGKSVLMQNIILGIACTNTTEQAKIVLIDPKLGVDYFAFEGLPHLTSGIIDKQETAIQTLNQLVTEMDRRYAVLKENRALNIFDLNIKPNATEHLPFLWVIHDEFAEWMMTPQYSNEVSDVVGRLGVKARAAGISLVFAAQRPDASVMPMQLRANLGNRLVLRVDGEGTSEIALGEKGAERLLGKGHLAAKLEGESSVIYAQVPFVSPEEIDDLVRAIRRS
jgi:S-DNA-T family DNA segregation ATPase FtsK/SpoIIIE